MNILQLIAALAALAISDIANAQGIIKARCKFDVRPGQTCEEAAREAETKPPAPNPAPSTPPRVARPEPPRLPPSAIPSPSVGRPVDTQPGARDPAVYPGTDRTPGVGQIAGGRPSNLLDRNERFRRQLDDLAVRVSGERGKGSSNANPYFDAAPVGTGVDDVDRPARDPTFRGTPVGINGDLRPTPPEIRRQIEQKFGGTIPGGVVLEGTAETLQYYLQR